MDESAALCATHPESAAEGTCTRCGLFICSRCRRWQAERMLCLRCHQEFLGEKPSRRATLALVFATVGFCGFFPGLVAVVLGHQELASIRRGESPGSGEEVARLARNMGYFELLMLGVLAMGWVARH